MRPISNQAVFLILILAAGAGMSAAPAAAQCSAAWAIMAENKSLGIVNHMAHWDPDGLGPLPPELIIATDSAWVGSYSDNEPRGYVGRWNATLGRWEPLGGGVSHSAWALRVLPDGDLVVGGLFTKAGFFVDGVGGHGIDVGGIARWDGTSWHAYNDATFGLGVGLILTLEVLPNGDLVAGGEFEKTTGGVTLRNVARWSQSAQGWQAMTGGSRVRFGISR